MALRPGSTASLPSLAEQVSARLGWLTVELGAGPLSRPQPPGPDPSAGVRSGTAEVARRRWATTAVIAAQQQGQDPTSPWREGLTVATARQYGAEPPASFAATFVLQWFLQLLAAPSAQVAALSPWALDCTAAPVEFELDPWRWAPVRVQVPPQALQRVEDGAQRWAVAQARYTEVATAFVRSYAPGVKMSSRQRLGAVRDVWRLAADEARLGIAAGPAVSTVVDIAASPAVSTAVDTAVGPAVSTYRRESCCFIIVLPGARECAGCPRLSRAAPPAR